MLSHFIAFVLVGFVQIATAFWGGIVSVKSLPEGESKLKHYGIFLFLGVVGCGLTIWVGLQTYQAERDAINAQGRAEESQKNTQTKLDQSLLAQEHIKGQLESFAIVLGAIKSNPSSSSGDKLAVLLQQLAKPVPVNSVLDAMNNQQLQESVLALVKQMRETDFQFEHAKREMSDRQWQAERAIPLTDKAQFTAVRDKNWAEMQQTYATQDNEFREKYLGRAVAARDQMLKRIPLDKVPSDNFMHGPSSLEYGHLLGATTVGMIADYLERLALALPMK
jgi:hypothetical protein